MNKEKKKLDKKQLKQLFVKLSWAILEHKFRYYHGQEYKLKSISDDKYDEIEAKYKKLAKILNLEPTACNHVGFPFDTPSGKLVADKLTSSKIQRP